MVGGLWAAGAWAEDCSREGRTVGSAFSSFVRVLSAGLCLRFPPRALLQAAGSSRGGARAEQGGRGVGDDDPCMRVERGCSLMCPQVVPGRVLWLASVRGPLNLLGEVLTGEVARRDVELKRGRISPREPGLPSQGCDTEEKHRRPRIPLGKESRVPRLVPRLQTGDAPAPLRVP